MFYFISNFAVQRPRHFAGETPNHGTYFIDETYFIEEESLHRFALYQSDYSQ